MCYVFSRIYICTIYVADCTICTGHAASYMFVSRHTEIFVNYDAITYTYNNQLWHCLVNLLPALPEQP